MKRSFSFFLAMIMFLAAFPFAGFAQAFPVSAAAAEKVQRIYYGDINENGKLEASDARLILRKSVNLEAFNDRQMRISDCNADGIITAADARIALRISVGLEAKVPVVNNAAENDNYIIGCTGPLTGDAASYGVAVYLGAMLAVNEINAAGGINGVDFQFMMLDDSADPDKTVDAYEALYENGMQVSLASVTSVSANAFVKQAGNDRLFTLTPTASNDSVITESDLSYRCCLGDDDQGIMAARKLAAEYENIGVIYDVSNAYSVCIYEAFEKEMKKLKKKFSVQCFDAENNRDFHMQVSALSNCDVIFIPIYYTEASLIAKNCQMTGCYADLFGCDGLDGIESMFDYGVHNRTSYMVPFNVNSSNYKVKQFVRSYMSAYSEKPNQFAANAYDAVYSIYTAMKTAGINNPGISPYELSTELSRVFNSATFSVQGVTGTITWNSDGSCNKTLQVVNVN